MPDRAFYTVARAVTFHRIDRVVIGGPGLKTIHAHAEYRIGMITIEPDVGFRNRVRVLWVRAVRHYAEMLVGPSRVIASPPDNDEIALSQFECWSLGDADVSSFVRRRQLYRPSRDSSERH